MFKTNKEPLNPKTAKERWTYLVKWERRLKRNVLLCRIIQPLGACIFTLNMLLATMNLLLAIDKPFLAETIGAAMDKVPLLPGMIDSFPRETMKEAMVFAGWFAFLIPLAISGLVLGVLYAIDYFHTYKDKPIPELRGTDAECAEALAHEAEWVYNLRRKLPQWSIFMETSILTALTVWPVLSICLGFLGGEDPAVLQIALSLFAMVVVIFVFFWFYAGCFWVFSRLNALYYVAPGEWHFWGLFNETDDYWESVDPEEYARRERVAARKKASRK